ncbi:DUF397 domain-containing protein [Nocardia huaxiensis]|uniref:DUF397 domain-containing protein n=3 Tax=Nocardia huaxiensis TaxID=2755382 RepID=A0A7D6Z1K5_9NOCA|nr:DUF397 domain-containing protein [Nocardia huaxiensis]QLY28364.1 DUF397 domain-containing protein [Nocardia huaxiensis]UFS98190.1 DUF397 domain-containing protein [Nocardia huaxiensis]
MTSTDLMSADWFKSSYSGAQGDCVEVAWLPKGCVGVRDSKDSAGGALVFAPCEWAAFTAGVRAGRFTRPA